MTAPTPELVQRVYSRSEGNALYAEEILAAGLDGRGSLPPTLRDALMLRVERLSPRTQELIRWLACQPAADHVLVAAVAGLDPADLRDALREAVASHIVVTVRDESYGFRHALLREVVYEDLLPGERTEMHAALAGALEERIEGGERGAHITAQVAHHWAAAGDQPRTLAAAARAGLAAERVNAFAEAQALFERVLSLWERVPDPEAACGNRRVRASAPRRRGRGPGRRPRAPGGAAAARAPAGGRRGRSRPRRAHPGAAQPVALEPAPPGRLARGAARGARAPAGRAERRRARSSWPSSRDAGWCSRASPRRRSPRVRRSAWRARSATARPRPSRSTRSARRSVRAARWIRVWRTCASRSRSLARKGLEMEEGGAWINISDVLNLAGRTDEALEAALQGLETAYHAGLADDRLAEALDLGVQVPPRRLGAARRRPSRRRAGGTPAGRSCTGRPAGRSSRSGAATSRLAAEAVAALARATADLTEPQFVGMHGILSAELSRRRGDIDAARAVIDDALDRIEFCSEDVVRVAALAVMGLRVEGDAGEAARDRRDAEAEAAARTRADALLERSRLAAEAGSRGRGRPARHLRGRVRTGHGRRWRPVSGPPPPSAGTSCSRPYIAAYARWREAEALMAGRDREGASRAASAALASRAPARQRVAGGGGGVAGRQGAAPARRGRGGSGGRRAPGERTTPSA